METVICTFLTERHQNIVDYCNRMKELYYPDWDQLLEK